MRRVYAFVILLVALSLTCACASEITKQVLDNGVTVIVKPEKGSGLVAIVATVRAGAAQETFQTAGIGNFVSQLLLASTRPSSAEEVAAVADEVGGSISAQWHQDYTEIRAVTTSYLFNRAMALIGESLTEANFEDKWVEQVRAKLLRDVRAVDDDVFEGSYADLRGLLYEDNGYRRPGLGFERAVELATPQDLRKYYATHYIPSNMVIAIAGDVTLEQAIDRVNKAFAGIPKGKLPFNRGVPDEKLDRSKFHASEADIRAAYLMVGWLAPGATSTDYPAMTVASAALGGGKGSVMFRELRQKRGMGYDLGTLYPRLKNQSHLLAYIITDPFKTAGFSANPNLAIEEVRTALLEQVNQLSKKPLSPEDLQRAKGYAIGTYSLSHQHLLERASELAWLETIGAGYEMYKSFADQVDKVTAEEVQRVANTYLTNYAAVLLLPKTQSSSPAQRKTD